MLSSCRFHRSVLALASAIAVALSPAALPANPSPKAEIAPHRAVYRMSLASARNASSVMDVQGRMQFRWGDACDAWVIEQQFGLDFLYAEGQITSMRLTFASWEAKDGLSYRFSLRKMMNGEVEEEVQGTASLEADGGGGAIRYQKPETEEITLPAGALFPTDHTLKLLDRAAAGDIVYLRTVFDGSSSDGPRAISAVVGDRLGMVKGGLKSPLLVGDGWQVRLAFFPLTDDQGVPEYELDMDLMDNGVARSMAIDYGDFVLRADLEELEPLPKYGC